MGKKECCTKKTLSIVFTIVVGSLLICLVIALYNIDWHPSSQEDESLEAFLKRKNATMEKQLKEINEQKKTIVELKMEIKQLRDENLQLKINWEFEKKTMNDKIKKQQNALQIRKKDATSLFRSCIRNNLSEIVNNFLTIHDILILRKTCKDFKILLYPNKKNMVMFCNNFGSKPIMEVPLLWADLKYFLDQSYTNALENMQMFILKEDQYAVFSRDKKMISWHNENAQNLYFKLIYDKIRNEIPHQSTLECIASPKIYNKYSGFLNVDKTAWATITNEGNVETGGNELNGGNSTHVQSQLKNVKRIASSARAFAALLDDGSVVAWGDESYEGEIPESIKTKLKNVKMIFSFVNGFAALLKDGSTLMWPEYLQHKTQLKNIKTIVSGYKDFAVLLGDGSVVESQGTLRLKNVKMIMSIYNAFAALLKDGSVVAWPNCVRGGNIHKTLQAQLQNVKMIFSSRKAFAALLYDGSVFAWGDQPDGGEIPDHIQTQLHQNVNMVFSNDEAFAALLKDGSVRAWGRESFGGKIYEPIQTQLINVKVIFSSQRAFAALLEDGNVIAWGDTYFGGTIPAKVELKNVKTIFPQRNGFIALCNDGTIIKW